MSVRRSRAARVAAIFAAVLLGGAALTAVPALSVSASGGLTPGVARIDEPVTTVKRLSNATGVPGQTVLVVGSNLARKVGESLVPHPVKFGTADAVVSKAVSETALEVTVPNAPTEVVAGATTVMVTVGTATKGPKFSYLLDLTVTTTATNLGELEPISETGLPGASITGTNFSKATKVSVGGKKAKTELKSATELTVHYPAGLVGAQDVVVSDARLAKYVGYVTYLPTQPTITAVSGTAVAELPTKVTLTGTDLNLVTSVMYDNKKATFTKSKDPTSLTVTIPVGAPVVGGVLTVSTKYGGTASTTLDRVTAKMPEVSGVVGADPAGGTVIVFGNYLLGLKSLVLTAVDGGTSYPAKSLKVEGPGKATATLPPLPAGTYDVVATTVAADASLPFRLSIGPA
ncbi:IPT/TIG domain-containing protein [Nocardioides ferulae]|uniref:IPT/TIG domain-containing protein n=1 Tax=Nocardioides ferulae TaxID=2340821 RepID=UPI000EB2C6CA|nr:IPT/TIG domain-containing protein [Nocardioides ferulae]